MWPYLIFIIVQLFAINSIDLYSSGLTLQAIFPTIKRWQCVLLDTTVAGALTAYAIFSSGFNTFITDFLLFMLIWIAPWVSIYLVDYFMRRGRYDSRALLDTGPGIYFRNGGINWRGLVAMGIGMAAAASWLNAYPAWTSPLTNHTGGADFSVFMGALFGGVVYWLLNRRTVAAEVAETDPLAEVADRPRRPDGQGRPPGPGRRGSRGAGGRAVRACASRFQVIRSVSNSSSIASASRSRSASKRSGWEWSR